MRIYRVQDDKMRDIRWYATFETGPEVISHGFSYLYAREFRQGGGDVMGFDNPLEEITSRNDLKDEDL